MKLLSERSSSHAPQLSMTDGGPNLYIEGIFVEADVINGNNRIYPMSVVDPAISVYNEEWIQPGSAVGELDHPENPSPSYQSASHRILSLTREGNQNYFVGKALILETIHGNQVRGLLKGGVRLGVSTRGLAEVESVFKEGREVSVVKPGLIYTTVDIVTKPSASRAFVKGLMEGKEWICESGVFVSKDIDLMRTEIKKENPKPKMTIEGFKKFMDHLGRTKS